jgi:biopolymer transport protein ExbD
MQQVVKSGNVRSEINVTPLVDVVLVLLIIFMVVTPMLQKGPAVKLPSAGNPPKKPDDNKQLLVAIEQNKVLWLEKDKISEQEFPARVQEAFQRNPGSIKDAGFAEVGLIVSKQEAAGK